MVERPYAGKLPAERRADRHARFVAATMQLIAEAGPAAVTVRSVCDKAALTSRYFYENFRTLDELLVAAFDDVMQHAHQRAVTAMTSSDGTLHGVVDALARTFMATLDDVAATRICFVAAWGSEALMRRRAQTLHEWSGLLADAVATHSPEADRAAIDVAAFLVIGGLLECVLAWLDGTLPITRDQLVTHFTAAAEAALAR